MSMCPLDDTTAHLHMVNAAVEMLRHFLLGRGIEMDKPEMGGRLHEK